MKRTIVIGATGATSVEMSRARLGTPPGGRAYTCPNLRWGRIKAVAQAVLLLATVLGFTHLCFADGKVFPPVAFPANVTIPDQRALIHFTNGTERLVIETRFTGAGTNFAWVVPLPAQPVIEEASTGLFPTLQYLFRPQVKHDVPHHFPWILALAWLGYVLLQVRPTARLSVVDVASCFLVAASLGTIPPPDGQYDPVQIVLAFLVLLDTFFVVAVIRFWYALPRSFSTAMLTVFMVLQLLPFAVTGSLEPLRETPRVWLLLACLDSVLITALIRSGKETRRITACAILTCLFGIQIIPLLFAVGVRSRSMGSSSSPTPGVSVLDRQLVGVFETTTIASHDPTALQSWLRENGFAASTNSGPVIESYVKDGWVFVAAKVRRDKPRSETSTPHPLSFTFKTDKPVYPMRLTGVDNGPLSVELYVFGRWRAEAEHFRLECCAHPDFPSPTEPRATALHWPRRSPGTPSIVHPLLRQWVEGAPVVTKLFATLTPAQMEKDVWLRWSRFREKRNQIYSESGALTLAMNWGSGLFTSGLVAAFAAFLARPALRPKLGLTIGFVTMASLALTGLIYIALPTTEIRLVKHPHSTAQEAMIYLSMWLLDTKETTRAEASAEIAREIAQPNDQNPRVRREQRYGGKGWDNLLLGGSIREEDSPGNFTLRVNGDELEFVAYDAQGGEHVLGSWRLRREP